MKEDTPLYGTASGGSLGAVPKKQFGSAHCRPRPWGARLDRKVARVLLAAAAAFGCHSLAGVQEIEYDACAGNAACGGSTDSAEAVGGGQNGQIEGGAGGLHPTPASLADCQSHQDCVDAHEGLPYLCRDGACVALTTRNCPRVLGASEDLADLTSPNPIVLGAFASFSADPAFADSRSIANFKLAVDEFNEASLGGLPGEESAAKRPILAVVCRADSADLDLSIEHLVGTLQVPAVIAGLGPEALRQAFSLAQQRAKVLFMSAHDADDELASVQSDGLLWHALGNPADLAPVALKLLERAEAYVNGQRVDTADAANPLRVTLVDSDYPTLQQLSNELYPRLEFNGKPAEQNAADGLLHRVTSPSVLVHATLSTAPVLAELQTHPPHIILALTSQEFVHEVMPRLELEWEDHAPEQARPFYLLSHTLYGDVGILYTFETSNQEPYERAVGVNFARYANQRYYQGYATRLEVNPSYPPWYIEGENYYDAAYYVLYALAAAPHRERLTGNDILAGLQRVIDESALPVPIGPEAIEAQVQKLWSDESHRLQLIGTLGPPNFEAETHRRKVDVSAWCMEFAGPRKTSSQDVPPPEDLWFLADVLRYDPELDELTGDFPCIEGF